MMDQILPVVYMIGVLLLVLPAFLQSNSKLKQFLTNFTIWIIVVLIILTVIYIFKIWKNFIADLWYRHKKRAVKTALLNFYLERVGLHSHSKSKKISKYNIIYYPTLKRHWSWLVFDFKLGSSRHWIIDIWCSGV